MAADDQRRDDLAAHIQAVARRDLSENDRLASTLLRRVWPAGHADRLNPTAAEWVRRWRPTLGGGALPPVCQCGRGPCAVCN